MKWLFRWPTRGHWKLPKPSRLILRSLAESEGKDHGFIPTVEVEVSTELTLEVVSEPIFKVIPKVTHETYALGLPVNLLPGEKCPSVIPKLRRILNGRRQTALQNPLSWM